MTFSTLITTHARTENVLDIVTEAIWSHCATAPESHLTVLDHDADIKYPENNKQLLAVCAALNAIYSYTPDEFHQTAWWNEFRKRANTDFVIFSNADVIFHPGWLDQIKQGIVKYENALSWHPVSCNPHHTGTSYVADESQLRPGEFCITANPLCHVIVSRRESGHIWDEQFPFYEADMDYHLTMEKSDLRACVCRGSRVDHRDGSNFTHSSSHINDCRVAARRRLEAKWNLPRIEYP